MLDEPIDAPMVDTFEEVVVNTDGESITARYIGGDGGIYTVQVPTENIAVPDPTLPEAEPAIVEILTGG